MLRYELDIKLLYCYHLIDNYADQMIISYWQEDIVMGAQSSVVLFSSIKFLIWQNNTYCK